MSEVGKSDDLGNDNSENKSPNQNTSKESFKGTKNPKK
jgi:hypothetical protein